MPKTTMSSAGTGHSFGDGDGVRAAIEGAGLTCAEFQILALEDLDTDDENGDALIETWRVLQFQ
jgi:hypothetical protein